MCMQKLNVNSGHLCDWLAVECTVARYCNNLAWIDPFPHCSVHAHPYPADRNRQSEKKRIFGNSEPYIRFLPCRFLHRHWNCQLQQLSLPVAAAVQSTVDVSVYNSTVGYMYTIRATI